MPIRSTTDWPGGDGEMAGRVRAHDWASTPLGPVAQWPQSLRTAVDMMLDASFPTYVWWGPDLIQFYNDPAIAVNGSKHPGLLGTSARTAWPDLWGVVGGIAERVLATGRPERGEDLPMVPERGGPRETAWFTFSYSALRNEAGVVSGLLITGIETTDRMRSELALRESEERQAFLLGFSDALRAELNADAVAERAIRMLSEHMGLDRCYLANYRLEDDRADITHQTGNDRAPPMPGTIRLSDFPEAFRVVFDQTLVVEDVQGQPGLSEADRRNMLSLGFGALMAPTLRKGPHRPLWVLVVVSADPRRWTPGDIALVEEVAERTWAAVERARAETALRESEERHRTLFDAVDEGFLEMEVIMSADGRAIDWRYIALNPAFQRLSGLPDMTGRLASEFLPNLEPEWAERFAQVVTTGEAARFDLPAAQLDRWFEVYVVRVGGPGSRRLVMVYNNVIERKRAEMALRASEERQAFLLELSDALRPLADPVEIMMVASEHLGRHLGVGRCGYGEVDPTGEFFVVERDWTDGVMPSFRGRHLFVGFGPEFVAAYRAGRSVLIDDALADARAAGPEAAFEAAGGVRASLGLPLVKDGRFVAGLFVQQLEPRHWTAENEALARDVAERTWAAVERARAEANLFESEIRFRTLAESIEDVFYVTDLDTMKLDYLSPSYERVWGRPAADLVADLSGFLDSIHPDDRGLVEEGRAAQQRGQAVHSEYRMVRPDGEVRWILDRCFPIPDGGRRLSAGIASDITERKYADHVVRESEERLSRFGEASQDILWIRDAETLQWTYLTPAFEAVYGLGREEALAGDDYGSWLDLIVPEDRDHARRSIERIRAGEQVAFEYRIRRPSDGTVRWLRDTDFPMRGPDGTVDRVGGIGQDVTEIKAYQAQIEQSEERLLGAVEVGRLGLWDWNVRTGEVHWSDEHFRMEGYAVGEVTPSYEAWASRLHPDDRPKAEAALAHAMETRTDFSPEFRVVHPDGSIHWLQGRGRFFYDDAGQATRMIGAMVDTTERREWEERQTVLISELQHRTRNLLSVMRSMADKTMRTSEDLDHFHVRFRDRLNALARAQGLLSRLHRHDRVTFDELIHTELDALAEDPDRVTLTGAKGIRLRSSTVTTLAMAIHELGTNAVKYGALGQPEGRLAVTWRVERSGDGERWLYVDWRESGVAMPPPGSAPQGSGQGRELIEKALPYQLGARTTYALEADGAHCTIAMPVSRRDP